jgi:LEA14-like dessication related protein
MPLVRSRSIPFLRSPWLAAVALSVVLSSCAGFGHVYEKPRVYVLGAKVDNISLESADLVFDVSVENPNAFSFVLEAVGYHLRVNGETFLDGQRDLGAQIAARGASAVQLPVTLRFADVLRVLRSLKGERHAAYDLDAEFRFAVPIVGRKSVPVHKKGDFSLDDLRIERLLR